MQILHHSWLPMLIPDWAHQLAELTRIAWSDAQGHCWFPYLPLTTVAEWETKVARDWAEGTMHSWVAVVDGRIVSHAALLNKGTHWELGRLAAHQAPRGVTHAVCEERLRFCRTHNIHARMECTQAHTRAQWHATQCGMRFAGIGTLDVIDGVNWDIVFFDTLQDRPAFTPRPGVLADPLGQEMFCTDRDRARLHEISHILTTDRGGVLPPVHFHILPELFGTVQSIILLNTAAGKH